MKKVKFDITGMSCSACSSHIEKKVNSIEGVSCAVNLLQNSMVAQFDEIRVSQDDIIYAVESIGYGAKVHTNNNIDKKSLNVKLIKLITSVIMMIVLMIVAMGHMFSIHIDANTSAIIQIILTTIIVALNFKYFTNGFKGLIKLSPNMDTLIALGSTASIV